MTSTKAQINLTSEQLKTTNKIFAEHSKQKEIIQEQDHQIDLLEKKSSEFEKKVDILNQVIENKDSILSITEKKHQYEKIVLDEKITVLKKQKTNLTIITILTTVITIGVIFMK